MNTSPSSLAEGETRSRARHGLAIYLALVVLLTVVFDVLIITINPVWILGRMFAPAAASVVARLVLREGFADVSFRFGGRRTLKSILLALVFPIVIGLVAYGIAWITGLAQLAPQPSAGFGAQLASNVTSSPVLVFAIMLALATFLWVFPNSLLAAGEEIGWRGYMLTRLIDAGVPRPVLASGLIWALWHIPLVLAGVYVVGSSPVVSAVLLVVTVTSFGFVIARMRLETGSIWPAIALHGAWNSIIQDAFDPATTGTGAALWVGEAGILTALASVVAAVIVSRGRWTMRRVPESRQETGAARPVPQT